MRRLIILGSTGSIGTQALEVVDHLNGLNSVARFPFRYEIVGLAAGRNVRLIDEQSRRFPRAELAIACEDVRDLAMGEQGASASFSGKLLSVRQGFNAAERLVREVDCDVVLAAMVGSAGLPATLAAVELGCDVALANKETLVAAGALIVAAAKRSGSKLLPVDSEHSALWQCLGGGAAPPFTAPGELRRAILTASGGPFRTWSKGQIRGATPEQALRHPTWTMGRKVTVDSASLMNKALEIIEAHWLFGIPASMIEAVVHPQSLVHAIAEFSDGTAVAQMAAPDMRTPIQHALSHPSRGEGMSRRLDWSKGLALEFNPVEHERFPLLALGRRAIELGGTAGATLTAANEAAVGAFLSGASDTGQISFGRMQDVILEAVAALPPQEMSTLEDCLDAERASKQYVLDSLATARR